VQIFRPLQGKSAGILQVRAVSGAEPVTGGATAVGDYGVNPFQEKCFIGKRKPGRTITRRN
jgi:hypothetical protein